MQKGKDNSWQAPDTTAFKNVQPGDIPSSTYDYRGDNVGNKAGIPGDMYDYKGDSVGNSNKGMPEKTSDTITNYKGDSVGKKSAYKGNSQV